MKTDANFKLSKPFKRMLAMTFDPVAQALWKKAFISADVTAQDKTRSRFVMNYDVSEAKARQILAKG